MKFRAVVVPFLLVFVLSGCAPEPPAPTPSPTVSASPSPESPSPTPSPVETSTSLVIPFDCDELVPITVIHNQFSSLFESIYFAADLGDDATQSFAARNGLTCLWGIPQSDAGFATVFVAERGTESDQQQVAEWKGAGFTECPGFLDACFFEEVDKNNGEVWTAHMLVGGFELRVQASSTSLDPLQAVAKVAATNMGYQ